MDANQQTGINIQYIDRIQHMYSNFATNDEELAFAKSVEEQAEMIEVAVVDESRESEVTVSTAQAIYHFRTFRTDYIGHASRTLVDLFAHFRICLPIEFIVANREMTIYLTGNKVVVGETEYPIEVRDGQYQLVEPVQWMISSSILDVIVQLAEEYQISFEEVVESAIRLISEPQPPQQTSLAST